MRQIESPNQLKSSKILQRISESAANKERSFPFPNQLKPAWKKMNRIGESAEILEIR